MLLSGLQGHLSIFARSVGWVKPADDGFIEVRWRTDFFSGLVIDTTEMLGSRQA